MRKLTNYILYFNVKRTIWLKGYQNGIHIEPEFSCINVAR